MKTLNEIISENLILHRKNNLLTQSEVAYLLNYSDKSVSKWEQGHSIPTLEVLMELSKIYNVTLDELVTDKDIKRIDERKELEKLVKKRYSRLIISLISITGIWIISTIIYSTLTMLNIPNASLAYLWSVPTTTLMAFLFNIIWGKRNMSFIILSLLLWLTISAIYITTYSYYPMKELFYIGVPIQVVIFLTRYIKESITQSRNKSIKNKNLS